ncbi:hydroxyisourate hydrolase [Paenibacillus beijingensis]|uniref:5-hydroxyisourate hydrolase n=1 Tax=Paenibacillus beijingensis TaxID=1126833 RepID=A0A0D5NKX5_9BACL|nr:hydroxyisourate hydrolase [Paenibacillus beijingensis]AJY75588.1 5-hydroxyisourate hydrolase [Paenibacillus beijingensis]
MSGRLTTHVLDTAHGKPAGGMKLQLWKLAEGSAPELLGEARTNDDGRLEAPLLQAETMVPGGYELVFFAGDYFRELAAAAGVPALDFLDLIPVRFNISEPGQHYHVPLLVAPGGYSTYRGS